MVHLAINYNEIMKNQKKLKDLFAQVRGMELVKIHEGAEITVDFYALCKNPLKWFLFHTNETPISVFAGCFELMNIVYSAIVPWDHVDCLFSALEETLKLPHHCEDFESIPNFETLDKRSKQKYIKYVKFLRHDFLDGWSHLSADEVLEEDRHCGCGSELFTKAEEFRTILEFNRPQKVFSLLNRVCTRETNNYEDTL